jgi:UDP-2,3-diacylglucosamine pyrophosphatase LpxH
MNELCEKDQQSYKMGDVTEFRIHEFRSLEFDEDEDEAFKFVLQFADKSHLIYVTGGKTFGLTNEGREICKKQVSDVTTK